MAEQIQLEVTRAFYLGKEPQKVGARVTVERNLAAELVHAGKAIPVKAAAAKPAPMTTETASAMVPGRAAAKTKE